ncbi:MAG: acyltransferase family protein [Tepidisphaerales bacterium]
MASTSAPPPAVTSPGPAAGPRPRLLSLDVFRGATVAAMILVNNPGSWSHIYDPLEHAAWHGCTPTDLIMPFFLFIVGVSIVYALDARKADPAARPALYRKIASRTLILFVLGLLLAVFPSSRTNLNLLLSEPATYFGQLRIMGVLQRIAVVYAVCALLFLWTSPRTWLYATAAIVAGYFLALTVVPVPVDGYLRQPPPTTLPAGLPPSMAVPERARFLPPNLDPATNLAAVIDRTLLTARHLYRKGPFDPEGPFSTVSAIATGLIGMLAGFYLKKGGGDIASRIAWLFTAALALTLAGWTWGYLHPLNKQLWTSSYTLYTAGLALALLAGCYWLFDVQGYRRGTAPFVWFGVNAIAAFWGSGFLVRLLGLFPQEWNGRMLGLHSYLHQRFIAANVSPPELASLVYAVLMVLLWTAIVGLMWRMKWIIKV